MRTMGLAALASLLAAGCGGEGDTAGAGRGFSVLYQTELDRGADEVPD